MKQDVIAVLGGGNGAHMISAELSQKGYLVNMFELPEYKHKITKVFQTRQIEVVGDEHWIADLNLVTDDIDEAVRDAKYIIILTPAFAHQRYGKLLKGRVKKEQVIITIPGAFAALQMRKIFEGEQEIPLLADVNNLPYDARLSEDGKVALYGRNKVNISFLPADIPTSQIEEIRKVIPFERVYEDVLECGLSIVNPAWHTGPCLLSATEIERPTATFFVYEHGWTPSACRVNLKLDRERKAVGEALGYHLRPNEDFSGMPEDYTWQDIYAAGHGSIALTPICGPNNINDRYLTEDCPYGLVPWASIGGLLNVPMHVTNSCINIYNVIHDTDWREKGLTAKDLGIDNMSREEILAYVKTGRKAT